MMHQAAKDNNTEEMKKCLKQEVNVQLKDSEGWTPLAWAAFYGNEELVRILLTQHNAAQLLTQEHDEEK